MNKKAEKNGKAIIKREKKRLEAEERVIFLKKEHLRREIESGAKNAKRFQQTWKEMVVKMKMSDMKMDIEIAEHVFDYTLDIKDYSISFLLDAIESAGEQYQMNKTGHFERIDQFIEICKLRLVGLENNFQKNIGQILIEARMDSDKAQNQSTKDNTILQTIARVMQQHIEESLNNAKSTVLSKIESKMDQFENFREIEANTLSKIIKLLNKNLQNILNSHMEETKDLRREYDKLRTKDEKERNIINCQLVDIAKLFEKIRDKKEKMGNFTFSSEKQISMTIKEKNFFQGTDRMVKNKFLNEQKLDEDQLKIMTVGYNKTVKHLEQLLRKLESIHTLTRICQNYETEEEKVIPSRKSIQDKQFDPSFIINWKRTAEIIEEIKLMENFWKRVAAAQILLKKLKHERGRIKGEAMNLRENLKNYIFKVSDEISRNDNIEIH